MEDDNLVALEEAESVAELTHNMKSLWVEKYAPRRYTELLSEEVWNHSIE